MKKILIILAFMAAIVQVEAQQLPQYSQYLLNNFVINPAIAGSERYFEAKSNHRYQWVGITDAPRTYMFSLNGPIRGENMGVGAQLFTDITGPTRRTGLQLSYAYKIRLSEGTTMAFGASAGLLQFMIDGAKVKLENENDLALSSGIQSVFVPDVGMGVYIKNAKYFFSLSAPQIYPSKLEFFENISGDSKNVVHLFASGGYIFQINDDFQIEPSALVKYVSPTPMQMDGSLRVIYQDKIWLAGSYRHHFNTGADVAMILGYTLQKNLTLAYAYDVSLGSLGNYSTGSHELMIAIKFRNRTKLTSRSIE